MLSPDLVPLEPESVDTETPQLQPPVTYKAELGSLTDYDTLTKALSEISQDACTADRIKEVVLYSLNSWDDFYTMLNPGGLVSFIRSILPTPFFYRHPLLTVLERLSHVRIFQLRKASPFQSTKFTSSAFFAAMGRIMASTEHLHIEEVTFANSQDLLSFVTAFRRITSLNLLELSFKDPTTDPGLHTPPSGMPSTPAPLRDLHYSATWHGKLNGLLPVCSHYASTLRSLKLLVLPDRESNRHQNLPNISELRALETLDVAVWDNLITPDYNLLDDIGALPYKCREMKTFIGHVNLMDHPHRHYDPEWFYKSLAHLPNTIQAIQLHITAEAEVDYSDFATHGVTTWVENWSTLDWERIDRVVAGRHFPSLTSFTVQILLWGPHDNAQHQEWVNRQLSQLRLAVQGILRVVFLDIRAEWERTQREQEISRRYS